MLFFVAHTSPNKRTWSQRAGQDDQLTFQSEYPITWGSLPTFYCMLHHFFTRGPVAWHELCPMACAGACMACAGACMAGAMAGALQQTPWHTPAWSDGRCPLLLWQVPKRVHTPAIKRLLKRLPKRSRECTTPPPCLVLPSLAAALND